MKDAREIHEAANIFPLDEANLDGLAADIKANGQLMPIELLDGKILDGRRRYLACQRAGMEPRFITVGPSDPVAYVLSLNLHRRHLDESQRAMVGARARGLYDERAKERMLAGKGSDGSGGRGNKKNPPENLPEGLPEGKGDARDQIGAAVGVSGRTISHATKVLKEGTPKLIAAVDQGKVAVSAAAKVADMPPEVQEALVDNPAPPRQAPGRPARARGEGVGIFRANEAVDCLKRIPRDDPFRERAFQIVKDWIRQNK